MVVLEAMACGLPVITTTNSCAHDVVKDGYNGFVVPIRDAMALKDRIRCILDERETQFKMGLNSRRTVIDNFTLQHYEKRLGQKLIKQL
ncbi:glycosyltransferase, partial [Vibrio alginolyticus]|uniref:glycosyltransferase n=1 Tax=Vibrio alginolyticus TaxID=663 RepID=UPI001A9018A9|nr:glycosyltransferase family 4 protein [Vibrio alginolyticus]